jgi:hypothetical protein
LRALRPLNPRTHTVAGPPAGRRSDQEFPMTDSTRDLTSRFASVYDKLQDHSINMDNLSIEDVSRHALLVREAMMAVWTASLGIKAKDNLMKSSLEAIK